MNEHPPGKPGGCRTISCPRLCRGQLIVAALFVKGWVHKIYVLFVQPVFGQAQTFAEALEVDDLPGTQELDGIVDVRIIGQAQNLSLSGTVRHTYLEGPPQHKDPANFITQVALVLQ